MKISVCMATYNGERFIREQLSSILSQLGNDDEIVLVGDASSDETVHIAEGFSEYLIRIFRQARNCEVFRLISACLRPPSGPGASCSLADLSWRL
jgi:glycosyltransferase involved in cell wall biosynthesis